MDRDCKINNHEAKAHTLQTEVEMSDIKVERKGEVEWITLNRPDRMNAYDAEMAEELIRAIENASDSGVIVLTGTGRAFCAGGDIEAMKALKGEIKSTSLEQIMPPSPVVIHFFSSKLKHPIFPQVHR